MAEGIVYVLINEAMPSYTKIGKTVTSVEQPMRELDSTSVPLPFECFFAAKVADMDFVERQLHDAFDDHRVRPRREFFNVAPERVKSALMLAALEDVTPRDDIVEDADDLAALNNARTMRGAFNFEMVSIPSGAVLTFAKDPSITATVVDNRRIEFEGDTTSLEGRINSRSTAGVHLEHGRRASLLALRRRILIGTSTAYGGRGIVVPNRRGREATANRVVNGPE